MEASDEINAHWLKSADVDGDLPVLMFKNESTTTQRKLSHRWGGLFRMVVLSVTHCQTFIYRLARIQVPVILRLISERVLGTTNRSFQDSGLLFFTVTKLR